MCGDCVLDESAVFRSDLLERLEYDLQALLSGSLGENSFEVPDVHGLSVKFECWNAEVASMLFELSSEEFDVAIAR